MIKCNFILENSSFPADTDVFKTSLGRLKKVTTSLRRLEKDVWFATSWRGLISVVLKTSNLRRLEDFDLRRLEDVWFKDVCFTLSWRHTIYNVLKTSDLWHLEDIWFTTSWGHPLYDVLKTLDLRCLEDVWFMTSWKRPIYIVLKTSYMRPICVKTTSV